MSTEDLMEGEEKQQFPDDVCLIDRMVASYWKEGRTIEALGKMESGLLMRKDVYGIGSPEFLRAYEDFVRRCNSVAMDCVQKDQFKVAYNLLKKAELLTEPRLAFGDNTQRLKLRAITFNNMGCFYKRRSKLHTAIQYLEKALKIEVTTPQVDNPAGTHLNLCACLSELGKHRDAKEHALCALELLENEKTYLPAGSETASSMESMLAVAHHNLAVQRESLGEVDGALESYTQALEVAESQLGASSPFTQAMKASLKDAQESAKVKRQRSSSRR
eukprot:GFYU01006705.1.p1 GENE.GFYU01006705.1~~GFYU01006705.1.p1  ORF type:complete len:274 (+),score=39.99 GFYU01006705.1:95-916(+)